MVLDNTDDNGIEKKHIRNDDPESSKPKSRKRRWGAVIPALSDTKSIESTSAINPVRAVVESNDPASSKQPINVNDARVKVLALQKSVKARLEAAKQQAILRKNQQQLSSVVTAPPAKKAKNFELDMSVTTPSFGISDVSKIPASDQAQLVTIGLTSKSLESKSSKVEVSADTNNSTQRSSNPYLSNFDGGESSNDPEVRNEQQIDNSDSHLLVRAAKSRVRNKGFAFVEPGLWQKRGDKLRQNQSKILESGFFSGRKKANTIIVASLSGIYGSGGGVDDEGIDTETSLPYRADTNPDAVQFFPSVAEWWDMELLPLKLKKKIASIEQEKDSKVLSARQKVKKSKQDFDYGEKEVGAIAAEGQHSATCEESSLPKHDGSLDGHAIMELQHLFVEQASLAYSKTAELVQHIVPIKPKIVVPTNSSSNPLVAEAMRNQLKEPDGIVLHLTKKEMKRQRKLRRQEKQREIQDLQAAGLIEAPEPRLTLQNFFQVLGDTAITDPSKIEKVVQEQMQARQEQHLQRNAANKLTKEQRAAKRLNQLTVQDTAAALKQQINVALFYVLDVTHPYHRTKIDLNAQQLSITGCVIECSNTSSENSIDSKAFACVVAEGNPRSIKRFLRLMTVRMKWTGLDDEEEDDNDIVLGEDETYTNRKVHKFNPGNRCELIWQGLSVKRSFHGFLFQECETSQQARKLLKVRGVEHYWDRTMQYHSSRVLTTNSNKIQFKLYKEDANSGSESIASDPMVEDAEMNNDGQI